jgi:hypothetical protein
MGKQAFDFTLYFDNVPANDKQTKNLQVGDATAVIEEIVADAWLGASLNGAAMGTPLAREGGPKAADDTHVSMTQVTALCNIDDANRANAAMPLHLFAGTHAQPRTLLTPIAVKQKSVLSLTLYSGVGVKVQATVVFRGYKVVPD